MIKQNLLLSTLNLAIKAIPVKCDNIKRGCTWVVGTVGTLEEHVAMCQFTLLPCPKECKDKSNKLKQFMRKDVDKHLEEDCPNRDYSCKHCGEKGTYASIQVHYKTCEKKEVILVLRMAAARECNVKIFRNMSKPIANMLSYRVHTYP